MKVCIRCHQEKDLSEFYEDKKYRDGHWSRCKVCFLSNQSKKYKNDPVFRARVDRNRDNWRKKNPRHLKEVQLKQKFGLEFGGYDKMMQIQMGKCAICGGASKRKDGVFDVDHNHTTGKIRGLLCNPCNMAIGLLGDNVETLLRAIEYLRFHADS